MSYYRIYMLNNEDHIIDVVPADCETDDQAMAKGAELFRIHRAIEVWNLGRIVGRLMPSEQPDPRAGL